MKTRESSQNHTGTLGFPKLGDDIVTDLVKVIPVNDHSTCVAIYQNSISIQSFKRARVDRDLLHPVKEQGGHAPKGPITTYANGDQPRKEHPCEKEKPSTTQSKQQSNVDTVRVLPEGIACASK